MSLVIPTYGRDGVLLATIRLLLPLMTPADELLVMDQTPAHSEDVEMELAKLNEAGAIQWVRLPRPSIPAAMNAGLVRARGDCVLFLDDDIEPAPGFLEAHRSALQLNVDDLIAGRVIQPWNSGEPDPPAANTPFGFNSGEPRWINEFMAGNCSARRAVAMEVGGFDENFVGAAYRFERDFADRLIAAGHRIRYEPRACIKHLKAASGGTRAYGEHLTTIRPHHSVGEYYYLLMSKGRSNRFIEIFKRPFRAIATRHHVLRPWFIPLTLVSEGAGFVWAVWLAMHGRRLLPPVGGATNV